ncbi:MAG: hypothetical protein HY909_26745 [Deltaproteobacteria bacterium]|nr:hypothetical protein [Deltaproteobacteria bacterium]
MHLRRLGLVFALLAGGCPATTRRPTPVTAVHQTEVNGATVADAQRELDETEGSSPDRLRLRDAVTQHLARRGLDALEAGDYDGAIERLRAALSHHSPEELGRGALPQELAPLARALLTAASARGDEAHALAAARVLLAVATPDPEARATFDRIREWGTRNRTEFQRPWVRAGELAEVYREIARIIPAPDVLDEAASQLVQRRRAAQDARPGGDGSRLSYDEMRQLQTGLRNTAADLSVLFLRVGALREAARRVTALGGADARFASAIGAIAEGEGGADGLAELVSRLERVDAAAATGVCRVGRRTHPADARFALCLAVGAERERDHGLVSAHLEAAAGLSPADSRALRAAIEAAARWLGAELGADDLAPGRRAYARAMGLLERWRSQHPEQRGPVAVADLEEAAAQLELASGNLDEARAHLERATRAEPASRDAHYTLAEIAWRHNDGDAAVRHLREGLAMPLRPSESDSLFRPQFMVRVAQATRSAGREDEARRLFQEAATALDAVARSATGRDQAQALFQRAVVADALGDHGRVRTALQAALDAVPDQRDMAALAITFCLARGRWEDARDLDRSARAQLALDRPWQSYFGLWGVIAARLGHLDQDGGARAALEALAATASEHSPWTVRLAQRFTGSLEREALLRHARTHGQRAEAHFYEAMLRLADGDAPGAEAELQAVLQTEVLRYFEYDMAWEMSRRHVRAAATPTATPASTATAATTAPGSGPAPATTASATPP